MTTEIAIGSEPGAVAQEAPYRKRSPSFTQTHALLDDVPQKRGLGVPPEAPRPPWPLLDVYCIRTLSPSAPPNTAAVILCILTHHIWLYTVLRT